MPNHFHFLIKATKDGGIKKYMQRVGTAYAKYFNTKYQQTGHLFQGGFKSVHVASNSQLLHLSSYIHKNPREIKSWHGRETKYPWSSYQDYVKKNRWGKLLNLDPIMEQFDDHQEYEKWVRDNPAKEFKDDGGWTSDV